MPSVIFACIISMSVAASICIILFFLLRIITKKLFSNTWHYYIWLAVVCLFLIPFKLNIPNADFRFIPVTTDEILKFTAPDLDVYEISAEPTEINPLVQIVKALPLIWLGGVMFTLLYKVIMYSRFALFIKKMGVCSDKAMPEYAVHNSVKIKKAHINAPFLMGILTPVIYLPDVKLDDTEYEMVIAHEMTHFKRKDILYKLVIQAVLCIHWFNPLAYLMNRDMQKHCELSCDEKTISKMDDDKRKIYMKTILNLIGRTSAIQSSMTTAMGASKSETEKRIQMIIKNKKISARAKYISLFAAVVLLFVGILTASQFNAANAAIPDNMQNNIIKNDDFENIAKDKLTKTDTPAPIEKNYEDIEKLYKEFGLITNSEGNMYYEGHLVRQIWDAVTGVGTTINLSPYWPKSSIDLIPVYENGIMTGLRIATQEEYDDITRLRTGK